MGLSLKFPRLAAGAKVPVAVTPVGTTDVLRRDDASAAAPRARDALTAALERATGRAHSPRSGPSATRARPAISLSSFMERLTPSLAQKILFAIMIVALALAGGLAWLDARTIGQDAAATAAATELEMLTQRIGRSATLAGAGNVAAVAMLQESRERFAGNLQALAKGGTVRGGTLDPLRDEAPLAILGDIQGRWARLDAAVARIVEHRNMLAALESAVRALDAGPTGMPAQAQQLALQYGQAGASPREVDGAAQLAALAQRLARNVGLLAQADGVDTELVFNIGREAGAFRDTLNGVARTSESLRPSVRAVALELARSYGVVDGALGGVVQGATNLLRVRQAVKLVGQDIDALATDVTRLSSGLRASGRTAAWFALFFGFLALAAVALLTKLARDEARAHALASERENKRNQEAILRLLNEMGNLADGDLTMQASVTEDVTGAIADSINFTIEELRTLVKGINSATGEVTRATQDAEAISTRLYQASQQQNREIQQASALVLQMAESIREVSESAEQSARVARQSLTAAETGAQSVQDQISGMNEIRAQIQDTSKRIKRLGESSMEIGEIVELISEITEQTNVLALNAAIQAASAGEAGRGFTVVAEEVQRLAERSAAATRQIDAIVRTIQADTQDAVAAMEKSTVGVVEGTKLSDAAGQALEEIRRVSRELAELISGITEQTQQQSSSVRDVTRGMQGILRITEETTAGTEQTNVSIAQLTRLAADLRASVAGFKV